MMIREENADDVQAIALITTAAFAGAEHSSGTEADIVDRLRAASSLALSLVAEDDGAIVGHVAFSPVTIDAADRGWMGLGPVSVQPDRQSRGVGAALIGAGLAELRSRGVAGCVVLGDPRYYRRFGFASGSGLYYDGTPSEFFMAVSLDGSPPPSGRVNYCAAFYG